MKILYVGTERAEAQALAAAVSSLREGVSVSWTSGLDQAAHWIDHNDGPRVLVVEAQPDNPAWRPALTYAAGLSAALPVVVIVPEAVASDLHASALDGHECIARNPLLFRELPGVITRAIDRARKDRLERAMRDMVHEQFREAALEVERVRRRLADAETALHVGEAALSGTRQELESTAARLHELTIRELELEGQIRDAQQRYAAALATADRERTGIIAQLREVEETRERARRDHQSAVADIARLTEHEAELERSLNEARATREALEQTVARTAAALQTERAAFAAQLHEVEQARNHVRREHQSAVADITRLTERAAELEGALKEARATREALEQTVARTAAALQEKQKRHAEALANAAGELAARQADFERERTHAEGERAALSAQLREVEDARDQARREHESAVADITRLTEREAGLEGELREARAMRETLEDTASRTAAALQEEQQRHADALTNAAGERAALHADIERERGQAEAARTGLIAQLREVEEARDHARREHHSAVVEISRLTGRESGLEQAVARTAAALQEEQQRHAEALATAAGERAALHADIDRARREHESAVTDIARLTKRESDLEGELQEARAMRETLEDTVTRTTAALHEEQQRHAEAVATAAGEMAARLADFEHERVHAEGARAALSMQLREVVEACDHARREHQSAVANIGRLTQREAGLEGELREERAARETLEQTVAGSAAALHEEQQRHAEALAAAAIERTAHQADVERERGQAGKERAALTAQLRDVEEARDHARREHESAVTDIARLTTRESDLEGELREARAIREALEDTVTRTAAALQQEQQRHADAVAAAAGERTARLADYEREQVHAEDARAALSKQLRDVEEAREWSQREHQSAVADVTRLTEHAAAESQAAAARQADLEARMLVLEQSLHASQEALDARIEDLEVARRQCEVLQAEANQLPGLHHEIQRRRADNSRLFQQAPLPMFRCTKEGALTHANRMLAMLIGRSAGELRGADLAAAVFESQSDLSWLIERCLGSRTKESIETTWHRKDGSRLLVRLTASATASDAIECGVEDLTPVRVLNDRLSQAHRMEAVGRLATEVSVTCGSLLDGIHQNMRQLLVTHGSHPASAQRGKMLLEEISRAGGLLRQLAVYADEESRKPAAVELRTVVRDVAPVLKRVAGDAVEVQLPGASAPLNVDAGGERVKRLLVNLAAYGRERMPFGGRLKIELGTTVVDRHFAAKHPNVRLGPHALVTVTESRRATRTDGPLQLQADRAGANSSSVAVQPGVDLGTLQELVAECGGHLWMTVEPLGDMVVKIRLPLVTSYGEPPRRSSALGGRVRTLGQRF